MLRDKCFGISFIKMKYFCGVSSSLGRFFMVSLFLDFRHLNSTKQILQHRGGHPLHEQRCTVIFHPVLLSELALRASRSLYRQCQEERGETGEMERKEIWKALLKHIKHTFISRTNISKLPLEAVVCTCKVKKVFKDFR